MVGNQLRIRIESAVKHVVLRIQQIIFPFFKNYLMINGYRATVLLVFVFLTHLISDPTLSVVSLPLYTGLIITYISSGCIYRNMHIYSYANCLTAFKKFQRKDHCYSLMAIISKDKHSRKKAWTLALLLNIQVSFLINTIPSGSQPHFGPQHADFLNLIHAIMRGNSRGFALDCNNAHLGSSNSILDDQDQPAAEQLLEKCLFPGPQEYK